MPLFLPPAPPAALPAAPGWTTCGTMWRSAGPGTAERCGCTWMARRRCPSGLRGVGRSRWVACHAALRGAARRGVVQGTNAIPCSMLPSGCLPESAHLYRHVASLSSTTLSTTATAPMHTHPALQVKSPARGGVDRRIAARTTRSANGSLVLGQMQDCYGAPDRLPACLPRRPPACLPLRPAGPAVTPVTPAAAAHHMPRLPLHLPCCRRLLLPPVCPARRHGKRSHLGPSALQVSWPASHSLPC